MSSKAARHRAKVKKEDPGKYAEFLEKNRERNRAYRQAMAKKWEEEPHTRAQIEEYERKRQAKREREAERYKQKKAQQSRQTRNSHAAIFERTNDNEKRRKDMTDEERRVHDNAVRKRHRDARSSQKKTADDMKRRRKRQSEKLATLEQQVAANEPKQTPVRLPKSAYNLNYEFKSRSKELNLTHEQYAQTALNLVNPRTPEKRMAIARLQGHHPCRVLFQCHTDDLETELGIDVRDQEAEAAELIDSTNPNHEIVKEFYQMESISRMLPHARYTTKFGAARVMTMTVKDAHAKFRDVNPDVSLGLTLFQQLRPRNVRLLGSVPAESCLCIYCTNVRLKLCALNGLLGQDGRLPAEGKLLNFINCPVDTKWNLIQCIDGQCQSCSDRLRPIKIFCRDVLHLTSISWKTWARGDNGKMEPITKEGSMKELLENLAKDLNEPSKGVSFSQHLFTAYWQHDQFRKNRRNPEDGEVVMVQDFAENRKAVYAEEIKSAHFGKGQITVHPVVCFYRNGEHIIRHAISYSQTISAMTTML